MTSRKTLQTAEASAAPFRVILYTLPVWAFFLVLMFFMPFTGIVGFVVVLVCLLILPFKARFGLCPECGRGKLFPFSGFGSNCKGCGNELVLRGEKVHLLEEKSKAAKTGAGRSAR